MAEKPKGPILPAPEPHTVIKHEILKKYLNAWFPILTRGGFPRVIFIDGFAGSGIYQNGAQGSPIIAIKAALERTEQITSQVDFIFIEQDKGRYETLQNEISKLEKTKPDNFDYRVRCADFTEKMPEILKYYNSRTPRFSAAFLFLDPFGYKGIPISLIKEIMKHPSCEVLITFMYDEINRFLSVDESDECRNDLFATNEWIVAEKEGDPARRKQILHDLYQRQLKQAAGIKYVRSFQMINYKNATDFFLFFGTNNPKGLREMKRSMWSVDDTGLYRFSDNTDPRQAVLFGEPIFENLKSLIKARYSGKEVLFSEVERFVLEETPYRDDAHLKSPILTPMEKAGEIEIFEPDGQPRKGRGFKEEKLLRFH